MQAADTTRVQQQFSPTSPKHSDQNGRNGNGRNGNGRSTTPTSFSQLLDEFEFPQPQRGDILQGEILRIEEDVVFIDVGSKRDALVPHDEVSAFDEVFLDGLSPGDDVPVYVTKTPQGDEPLWVSLERGLQTHDWERAETLYDEDEALELKVVSHNKGGLVVEFGRIEGFVPNSHIPEIRATPDQQKRQHHKAKQIDTTLLLKIIEVDPSRERLVLSATAVQKKQQQEQLQKLSVGDVLTGTVTGLKKFGAFVDVGNRLTGLVHISKIDWEYLDHPADKLAPGEEISVQVDDIDLERQRLSLNRKALLPDPWEQFAEKYEAGDWLEGEVTAVVEYGAFIKLTEDVKGLLHKNQINLPTGAALENLFQPGDTPLVQIAHIDLDRERVSLSTHLPHEPV
jgi:small subunit ribosomal protein S1